ncbi:hypothetical protein H5410_027904 [Solanum commersonii]|uniref:Uncharacterized protein n=1 Tax=Solanum commersonii TaxID=4109 RepID=A0A9J5Z4Q3_SOLCO|nr:hypothetical protein H5410_027904 [Solanum commersonii]
MSLFQTEVRFLGHFICQGKITPIKQSIDFASKFPDVITDRTQLQRFLRSLNYISPFYKYQSSDVAPLYDRLKKNHKTPWIDSLTNLIKNIKLRVKSLSCLTIANPTWQKIVETDASNIEKRLITLLKVLPLNRDMKEVICWKIIDGMMEPPWVTKGRGKGNNPRGRGRYSLSSSRSSYGSSSNTPIIQKEGMSLFNLNSKAQDAASSIHLEDIPENNPLYA